MQMAAIVKKSTIFFGWTLPELQQVLERIKRDMLINGGDFISSYSFGGKTINKTERIRLSKIYAELKSALQELDPDTYGANTATTTGSFRRMSL